MKKFILVILLLGVSLYVINATNGDPIHRTGDPSKKVKPTSESTSKDLDCPCDQSYVINAIAICEEILDADVTLDSGSTAHSTVCTTPGSISFTFVPCGTMCCTKIIITDCSQLEPRCEEFMHCDF